MWIRIVDIDFTNFEVSLETRIGPSEEPTKQLDTYVSKCRAMDFVFTRLYYLDGTQRNAVRRLKNYCKKEGFSPPKPTPDLSGARGVLTSKWVTDRPAGAADKPGVEYRLRFKDMATAAKHLNVATILISESIDLDPRSQFKLRLCLYELVTNTVEHGTFATNAPEIRVKMLFTHDQVAVSYADNAAVFLPDCHPLVDLVEEKIRSSNKRGLGLYLLNNICDDWKYKRTDDWNNTTFTLDIGLTTTSTKER